MVMALEMLVKNKADVDLVIMVSDNESWIDTGGSRWYNSGTATMAAWDKIKRKNKSAKMVCIDLCPYGTTQAPDGKDILNVGGFSDVVFDVIAQFAEHGMNGKHWVEVIDSEVELS